MPLDENFDAFLADFGVAVSDGVTATNGILDAPGEVLSNGQILSVDYALTIKASVYPSLDFGDALTVGGVAYSVRLVLPQDDGAFSLVYLSKV